MDVAFLPITNMETIKRTRGQRAILTSIGLPWDEMLPNVRCQDRLALAYNLPKGLRRCNRPTTVPYSNMKHGLVG